MKNKLTETLATIAMVFLFMIAKHFLGFENAICFISASILVELWSLNIKD